MKFELKGPFKENVYNLMWKASYHFLSKDEQRGELSFARPPRGYPRFHLFLKIEDGNLIFNLHLDQKRPIYPVRKFSISNGVYEGAPAHAGEYDSETVQKEAERIKEILKQNAKN